MSIGILNNESCRKLYEKINNRKLCVACKQERQAFSHKDKKHNGNYSNLIPGFSSRSLRIPIDLVIAAEAHGGGRADAFRKQESLCTELEHLETYYLKNELSKFHQSEMRKFLTHLNSIKATWVFTDLLKCYVWQGQEDELNGSQNVKLAIKHCSSYLRQQLNFFKPKVILSLGNKVSNFFEIKNPVHGDIYQWMDFKILHSTFPSRNTADRWVKNKEWGVIINSLNKEFSNYNNKK